MKLLDVFKTASGNLLQSKLRSFLTIVAVFIGAFTLTLTNGMGSGISSYIDDQVGSLGAKNVLVVQMKQGDGNPLSSAAPKKYDPEKVTTSTGFGGPAFAVLGASDITAIGSESGITGVEPQSSITPSYVYGAGPDKYEITTSAFVTGTELAMTTGSLPNNASAETEIAIASNYVSSLGYANPGDAVGKTVHIGIADPAGAVTDVPAKVVGVQAMSLVGAGGANINKLLGDRLYAVQTKGLPAASVAKYPAAVAYFDSGYSADQIKDLKDRLDKKGYQAQTIEDTIGILKQVISGIVMVFNLFAIIALIAASFGVINTLLMAVQERTKEIGLMKAMGMSGGRIFLLFSIEAILLGFWGSFLGVLAAIGVGSVANSVASQTFLKDFEGLSLVAFPLQSILVIMAIIMAVAFLAGTLPARRASKLNPINALRYE